MSIRKKPEEAVPVLLARLHKAKECFLHGAKTEDADDANETHPLAMKFKDIESELKDMEHSFPKIKSWEKRVTEQFCALEQQLDNDIFKDPEMESQVHYTLDRIKDDIVNLRSLISAVDMGITVRLLTMSFKPNYLLPTEDVHPTVSQEWVDLGIEGKIFEGEAMSSLSASFHCLESSQVKMCLLCLSIFPENSVIQKKTLIYWWMGEGLVTKNRNQTAEEVGEQVFQELLNEGFIRPSSENKFRSVNSFIVYPGVRRMLILMAEKNKFLTFSSQWTPCNGKRRAFLRQGNESYSMRHSEKEEDLLTVFNVNEQYLGMRPEWLAKLKKVEVLQMGRWQNSVTHHIEVENEMLLNGLGSQTHLKYLGLRGISRIESLPASISKLICLQILDLRACHNLEKLPPGISKLRNLTHLDMSECYLLESVPKGLEKIHALQVLKGFVVSKAGKNTCKITDLAQLVNLRKLSIRVGNQGEGQQDDQLDSLINLHALCILKISWGVILSVPGPVSLPQGLLKLDLQCAPLVSVPQWLLPTRLPNLEKLYINGGELNSLDHQDSQNWKVKFLRLKYLKNLKIDQEKLVSLFPEYQYLEKISCHKLDRDISLNRAG